MTQRFQNLPEDAKVWVYAASRKLTPAEQETVKAGADRFFSGWTAHNVPVESAFEILDDLFLVIMVNEQNAAISGCGIDKSVAFMKEVERDLGLQLFNRTQIEILIGNELAITDKQGVKSLLENKRIAADTLTFNKTVVNKQQFDRQFRIPLEQAWFYRALTSH